MRSTISGGVGTNPLTASPPHLLRPRTDSIHDIRCREASHHIVDEVMVAMDCQGGSDRRSHRSLSMGESWQAESVTLRQRAVPKVARALAADGMAVVALAVTHHAHAFVWIAGAYGSAATAIGGTSTISRSSAVISVAAAVGRPTICRSSTVVSVTAAAVIGARVWRRVKASLQTHHRETEYCNDSR
jgi:hypothetical protein